MVSFAVKKLLSLIRSHLSIFAFVSITLADGFEKIPLQFMSVFCLRFPLAGKYLKFANEVNKQQNIMSLWEKTA